MTVTWWGDLALIPIPLPYHSPSLRNTYKQINRSDLSDLLQLSFQGMFYNNPGMMGGYTGGCNCTFCTASYTSHTCAFRAHSNNDFRVSHVCNLRFMFTTHGITLTMQRTQRGWAERCPLPGHRRMWVSGVVSGENDPWCWCWYVMFIHLWYISFVLLSGSN